MMATRTIGLTIDSSQRRTTTPPGGIVVDELEARKISYEVFRAEIGPDCPAEEDLLGGEITIANELWDRISKFLGLPEYMLRKMNASFVEAKNSGKEILTSKPRVPGQKTFSGNLAVRIPPNLHRRIAEIAKSERISINQIVLSLLAEGVGRLER